MSNKKLETKKFHQEILNNNYWMKSIKMKIKKINLFHYQIVTLFLKILTKKLS